MIFFRIRLTVKAIVVLTMILLSALVWAAEKNAPGDKAAVVNGVIITGAEFDRGMEFNKKRLAARGVTISEEQMGKFKNDVLDDIIDMELLYQESKKMGVEVKPEVVSEKFTEYKQQFRSEDEFNKWLVENNFTESDFRNELKRLLLIRKLIDKEVVQKVTITDEESKSFYDKNPQYFQQPEQVKASHILIKVQTDATDDQKAEARKKIEAIQQKVKQGEDFATLAKTYSEGPSAPNGGDLGRYFSRDSNLVKPFKDAAFNLKPHEVSDIVETQWGFHLIKVTDKKPAKKVTYAEVKDRLNDHLKKQKAESETDAYIETLRKGAKIEKFL
jgi:peptidyl-prolyl cis-trans isomerase C